MVSNSTVNVQFIHLTDGNKGKITEQQRADQIKVMNEAFNSHQIQFTYNEQVVKTVDNKAWFRMGHRSAAERQAKIVCESVATRSL